MNRYKVSVRYGRSNRLYTEEIIVGEFAAVDAAKVFVSAHFSGETLFTPGLCERTREDAEGRLIETYSFGCSFSSQRVYVQRVVAGPDF